jgi:two-component system, LytTR family, sensor kinase
MEQGDRRQSAVRSAPRIVVAGCLMLMAVSAMQLWVSRRASNEPVTAGQVLLFGAIAWLPWAVTAPLILRVGRSFAFQRGRRIASAAVHAVLFLLCYAPFTLGLMLLGTRLFGAAGRTVPTSELVQQVFAGTRMQLGVIVYAAILGLGLGVRTWQALRQRELEASRLEAQAAVARLEVLSARLQPHFIFNTLHAIGVLIDEDPGKARTMITLLGDLLRDLIGGSPEGEVPLRVELELLQRYLAIEQVRFADRLRVEIRADPDTLERKVPRLLLQPLAENALRHGLAPRAAAGTLTIACRLEGRALVLEVGNDGVPLTETRSDGVGLTTTRERLATREPAGTLTLAQRGSEVVARVVLP